MCGSKKSSIKNLQSSHNLSVPKNTLKICVCWKKCAKVNRQKKILFVLFSAHVKSFSVSHVQDLKKKFIQIVRIKLNGRICL